MDWKEEEEESEDDAGSDWCSRRTTTCKYGNSYEFRISKPAASFKRGRAERKGLESGAKKDISRTFFAVNGYMCVLAAKRIVNKKKPRLWTSFPKLITIFGLLFKLSLMYRWAHVGANLSFLGLGGGWGEWKGEMQAKSKKKKVRVSTKNIYGEGNSILSATPLTASPILTPPYQSGPLISLDAHLQISGVD